MRNHHINSFSIPTHAGTFVASFSERGLAGLDFPRGSTAGKSQVPLQRPMTTQQRRWQRQTVVALKQVLAGRKPRALPPLDWASATEFQKRVWQALLRIPPGGTKTYAQVAAEAGKPAAARAAGAACGANPIPVLVPCHRVVAANGGLGGFSGGLDWKRRLLTREGVQTAAQLELARVTPVARAR